MRTLNGALMLLALTTLTVWCEEVIHLETLTPTAYRWTWTARGNRKQVLNTNLAGEEVRIAGKRYERVIAGHSPMSYAWNLDGEALELRVEVGMDDQSSQVDRKNAEESNIFAEVLIDRQIVFRQQLYPRKPAIPLSFDLRGKHQLELRGNFGTKKFVNQNIMWCNPVLVVKSVKRFRGIADTWSSVTATADSSSPSYPPAPTWKQIGIQKFTYGPFQNAYRITTAKQELVLVPELGGRILHYSRPGGPNFLYVNLEKKNLVNAMVRGRMNDFAGGHFQRFEPITYFFPADPILKHGRYQISFPHEGEIVMTSASCPMFFLCYEYRLKIKESSVDIENILINRGTFPQKLASWPITRVNTASIRTLYLPDGTVREGGKDFPRTRKEDVEIKKPVNKLVYQLVLNDGCRWKITFGATVRNYMHLYLNQAFVEIESHGILKTILPGKRYVHHEQWSLQ